jgi:hypothetical protein
MIVNMTGIPGKSMGVDLNMEHNIGIVKAMFAAKGMHASWDHLADISAASDLLKDVKKKVASSLEASYTGTTHKTPDVSELIWTVERKEKELGINQYQQDRDGNGKVKPVIDALANEERMIWTGSLLTFNKKLKNLVVGGAGTEDDEDELPPVDIDYSNTNEE